MHRKTDINELDIPRDDIECWEKYPKHKWVYDLSRVLDAQHIKWAPFESEGLSHKMLNMSMFSVDVCNMDPGSIYTKMPEGTHLISEVYVAKGEAKLIRHLDPKSGQELPTLVGEVELRLSAFITLHFTKFTGVITTETYGNNIYKIQLRPHSELAQETNQEIIKLTKRIYRKTEHTQLSGLTDRAAQELIAS